MLRSLIALIAFSVSIYAQAAPELASFTHEGRRIWYQVKDGWAIAEGDIQLGSADELGKAEIGKDDATRASAVPLNPNGSVPIWPRGEVYYTIDANVPNQRRITDAIAHWAAVTPIRLVPRTNQPNYVRFIRPTNTGLCSSFVGMRGGEQTLNLGDLCPTSTAIHEIGHAVGLLHEQDRLDRNRWITLQYENLPKIETLTFAQFLGTLDAGYYDYDSIMHYSPYSFANNLRPVILTVPLGIPVGVRTTLSPGDIDIVQRLYGVRPARTTIATIPDGLEIEVDGVKYTSPQSFDWAAGTTHTLNVTPLQTSTAVTRHRFVRWTDGGALSHTFTAAANTTVVAATFTREYRVRSQTISGRGVTNVYPTSADEYYPMGTKIRVNAIPEFGQQFLRWSASFSLEAFGIGLGSNEFEIDVYGNLTFGATFTASPVTTIDVAPNDFSIVWADGIPWVAPIRFAWTPGSRHIIEADATQANLDETMRYSFVNWADGSRADSRTVTATDTSTSYTARYSSEALLFATFSASAGQLFVNTPHDEGYYRGGATVAMRAQPAAGRDLIFWLGDLTGRGKDRALLMDQPRYVIATFGTPVPLFPFHAAHRRPSPYFDLPVATVVPGQMIALDVTGLNLRNYAAGAVTNGRVATQLEGMRVLFDGVPAPILRLAPPSELTVMVPTSVAGKTGVLIEFERDGQVAGSLRFAVENTAPGIYTLDESGFGPAAARNADGSPNSPRNPALLGSEVTLRVTGAGLLDRPLPDGAVTGAVGARPRNPIYVRVNGAPAEILSAEPVAGEINGILEVKIRVPQGLIPGDHPVQFIAGVWASPPYVTLSVR